MSDANRSSDGDPLLPPATAERRSVTVTDEPSVSESLDDLVREFVKRFKSRYEVDLEEIRERTTVRNVVNYRAVDDLLDPGWAVAPEIVKFGDEALADALVFSHDRRSYDVILKPVDIFLPTDEVEVFIFDRERGIRHRLVKTTDSLDRALEHTVFQLTHSRFNPDAPYLASLIGDELAGGVDEDLQLTTE